MNMDEFTARQMVVNEVLAAHRTIALPISHALDEVWQVWLESGSQDKTMDALTVAWRDSQDTLKTLRVAHEGALEYFVTIKNRILRDIRAGVLPAGYPRPRRVSLPIAPASGEGAAG